MGKAVSGDVRRHAQTLTNVARNVLVVPRTRLQYFKEIVTGHVAVAQDLGHETGTDGFTAMHRHDRAPSIRVPEEVVTALHTENLKPCLTECRDDLVAGQARQFGHASTSSR